MGRVARHALLSILSMCALVQASAQTLPHEPLSKADRRAARHHPWCEWNSEKLPIGHVMKYCEGPSSTCAKRTYCQTCGSNGFWRDKRRCS